MAINQKYDPNILFDAVKKLLRVKADNRLAAILDVSPSIISKIRNGKLPLGPTIMVKIHEASNISIRDLRLIMGDTRPRFFEDDAL